MPLVPNSMRNYKGQIKYLFDGERQPTVSNGNNGGMDMMVDDKGVRINFSSRSQP